MRFKLTLSPTSVSNIVLPLNNSYYIAALIYSTIEQKAPDLAKELHASKKHKLFTFSKLLVNKRRFKIRGEKMVLDPSASLTLFFSTPFDAIGKSVLQGLLENNEIKIGNINFDISEIKLMDDDGINSKEKFTTLSPINVTTGKNENGRKKTVDLYSDQLKFFENLKKNLVDKHFSCYGRAPRSEELDIKVLSKKHKRIKIKNTYHRCSEMVFEAEGSSELLDIGYKAGFGGKNSMGFGMVKR